MPIVDLRYGGHPHQIEYRQIAGDPERSHLIFLHEGLGSLAMWRDYPDRVCALLGMPGLVYSRPGYGQSTPRASDERWRPDYLHMQAQITLPALLSALAWHDRPYILFGHSDGASIALIHAATAPSRLQAMVVLAPHVFVEPHCLDAIRQTRTSYEHGDLRMRLARYHSDPDSAFYGWCDAWLAPEFQSWNIEAELASIRCPVLAIQGWQDPYASMEQLDRIQAMVPHAQLLKLDQCGHTPFRDCETIVNRELARFLGARSADLANDRQ